MKDHRIRLNDDELALVVTALTGRAAGIGPDRRAAVLRLAERLKELTRGNPDWILGREPRPGTRQR